MLKRLGIIFFFVILFSCAHAATVLEDFNDVSDWTTGANGATRISQQAIAVDGNAMQITVDGSGDNEKAFVSTSLTDGNEIGFWFRWAVTATSHQILGVCGATCNNVYGGITDNSSNINNGYEALGITIQPNTWYFVLIKIKNVNLYDLNVFDSTLTKLVSKTAGALSAVPWGTNDANVMIYTRDVPGPPTPTSTYIDDVYDGLPGKTIVTTFISDYNAYGGYNYDDNFQYGLSYVCPSYFSPSDINLLVNDVNYAHHSLVCNGARHDINGFYVHPGEGLVNLKLNLAPDNNNFYDENFYFDLEPPEARFDINGFFSFGFKQDNNANAYLICDDNISPLVLYSLTVNDLNIIDGWFDSNSYQDSNFSLNASFYDLNAFCSDLVGNTSIDSNSYHALYSAYFTLVDETTGNVFDLDDINGIRVISPDLNYEYDFKSSNSVGTFYTVYGDDSLRFELQYYDSTGVTLSTYTRDISLSVLESDLNARICVPPFLPTFYEQIIASNLENRIAIKNPFSDCYVLADYTKYAYSTYLINRAWTTDMRYYLYRWDGGQRVVLASLEGSVSSLINLDAIDLGQTDYDIEVLTDTVAISRTTASTLKIYYKSLKGNNTKVKFELFDEDNNSLFSYTERATPNEVTVYYDHSGITLEGEMLRLVVTKTLSDGTTESETKYFGVAGQVGMIDSWLAMVIACILLIFALTFVGRSFALGWFGIVACLMALAFLTMAIPTWYIRFMQAVVVIILIFIGLIFKSETAGVT